MAVTMFRPDTFTQCVALAYSMVLLISPMMAMPPRHHAGYINRNHGSILKQSQLKDDAVAHDASAKKVVCYYPNWSQYRGGHGNYVVEDIDPSLCTHIVFAFARIVGLQLDTYEPNDKYMYRQLQNLKEVNPSLKTLLSVGGATMGNDPFIFVSSTAENRALFADNCISYARQHDFDGIDIDWEYPRASDRENFSEMIKELKLSFLAEGPQTGRDSLLLSAAFAAGEYYIHNSYDLATLGLYLDIANVMSYDLHGGWDSVTGFHSALYGFYNGDMFCQEWVINEYISLGMPSSSIMLGIPTYGRSFTLCSSSQHDVRDSACGYGSPGQYTVTPGTLAYYEICDKLKTESFTRVYDDVQEAPYAYGGNQWVGYDDEQSIKVKMNYVEETALGGVVIWDLSMDDFGGQCGQGNYPLLKTFQSSWGEPSTTAGPTESSTSPSTTSRTITTTTTSTTRAATTTTTTTPAPSSSRRTTTPPKDPSSTSPVSLPPPEIVCEYDGQYHRDPYDCSVYYMCSNGEASRFQCGDGLHFDMVNYVCNWPAVVDCTPLPLPV